MDKILDFYRSLLSETDTTFVRYLHDKISWNARMLGIVGARGVGKTTLLLPTTQIQAISEKHFL